MTTDHRVEADRLMRRNVERITTTEHLLAAIHDLLAEHLQKPPAEQAGDPEPKSLISHDMTEMPRDVAIRELCDAIRLTVEYVGTETLPPIEGWSWFDALSKYAPDMADALDAANRADRIEHDARCKHPKCPGGSLCCCLGEPPQGSVSSGSDLMASGAGR